MSQAPLLTIAIPTYNRSAELALLLQYLLPQCESQPEVELRIFDNASPDNTESVVLDFVARGLQCTYIRRPINVGPDENFLDCYRTARGKFVWILGDDDVIFEGGLARVLEALRQPDVDMVFVTPRGFIHEPTEAVRPDPRAPMWVFRNPRDFVAAVNFRSDFALISSVILNKEHTEQFEHPDYALGKGSYLIQLGWTFSCLKHLRSGALVDLGLLATCEKAPSRPFDMVMVFGTNWKRQAGIFLGERSSLYRFILDQQMYAWFPGNWVGMRRQGFSRTTPDPVGQMTADFRSRWTFWVFTWPLLALPLAMAHVWQRGVSAIRAVHRGLIFRGRSGA